MNSNLIVLKGIQLPIFNIALFILIANVVPCLSGKRRSNFLAGRDAVASTNYPLPDFSNMEDIINSPQFRDRKSEIADDPNVWSDALSVYDKLLSNRPQHLDRKEDPFRNFQAGLFVPWATGSESDSYQPEKRNQVKQVGHQRDYYSNAGEVRQVASIATRTKPRTVEVESSDRSLANIERSAPRQNSPEIDIKEKSHVECSFGMDGGGTDEPGNMDGKNPVSENGSQMGDVENNAFKTTQTLTFHERLLENSIMTQEMMYGDCGGPYPQGKVCYGVPAGCIKKKICRLVVSFGLEGVSSSSLSDQISVTLAGESPDSGFVAIAFSHDRFIGEDLVLYCINSGKQLPEPKVALYSSFTRDIHSNLLKNRKYYHASFCPNFGYQSQGIVACSFRTYGKIYLDNGTGFDIFRNSYYLMLAFGHYNDDLPVDDPEFGSVRYQHLVQFSEEPVLLMDALMHPENINPRSRVLIILHVYSSVIAFVFLIPCGMCIAKYGREIMSYEIKVMGRFQMPMWLWIHICLNALSVPLIFISIITIQVELDFTWRSHRKWQFAHSVFGIIAIILQFANNAIGWLFKFNNYETSKEDDDIRTKIATWTHWLIGNLSYLFGISCVLVAGSLSRGTPPCVVEYFGYSHLAIHCMVHVIMGLNTRIIVYEMDRKHLFQRAILGPMIPFNKKFASFADSQQEDLWKGRRRAVLFYCIESLLCAFAICGLMVLPVVLCR